MRSGQTAAPPDRSTLTHHRPSGPSRATSLVGLGLAFFLLFEPTSVSATEVFDAFALLRRGEVSMESDYHTLLGLRAYGSTRFAIRTGVPNRIGFPVTVPPNGVLRVAFAVVPEFAEVNIIDKIIPVRFGVTLELTDRDPVLLFERVVDVRDRPSDRRWHTVRMDLSAFSGAQGTLVLRQEVAQDPDMYGNALVAWSRPALFNDEEQRSLPNLLLITIDALRADHLSCYGYLRKTSPRLDQLAREGIRYDQAFTNAPMTIPSLPQILTSRYFPDKTHPTLATLLFAAGMPAMKAIVRNPYLTLWLTIANRDGFDAMLAAELDADDITRGAVRWIDQQRGDRFALYLHYLDTHTPYVAPAAHADLFVDSAYRGTIGHRFRDAEGARAGRYLGEDRRRIVDLYDGTIRYVDAEIGRLLDEIEARGLLDSTLVIVTADHGEEFWDHGTFFHGQSLFDEQLHVPLILRLPNGAAAGTVVRRTVRTADILPTIAQVMGFAPPAVRAGDSLLTPEGKPAQGPDSEVFARAANLQFPHRFGVRALGHKLVMSVETGAEELYDLARDPEEQTNLAAEPDRAAIRAELRRRLDTYRRPMRTSGFQIRALATDGRTHRIDLTVQCAGLHMGFPDRVDLGAGDRLHLSQDGNTLRWTGTIENDPSGIRFARGRVPVYKTKQRLTFTILVDGKPLPVEAIRLAHGTAAPSMPFTYSHPEEEPRLMTDTPPPLRDTDTPVVVGIWRAGEGADATGTTLSEKDRERLRALGYVE